LRLFARRTPVQCFAASPSTASGTGNDMSGDHTEAFFDDANRLLDQLKKINAALKKDPQNKKALAEKEKLAPFLTEQALKKRQELAAKLDLQALGKTIKETGLPW
jgi:hypothetical protein